MNMCVSNLVKAFILHAFFVFLCVFLASCGPMDSLFNSAGNYKINVQINDIPLDECSFAKSSDKIRPYFEHSVLKDPDITALMVYLRDPAGYIAGWKVIYKLDKKTEQDDTPDENNQEVIEDENDSSDDNDENPSNENQNDSEDESDNEDDDLSEESEKSSPPAEEISKPENSSQRQEQYKDGDELVIYVKNFDNLPLFPIPDNLPMGHYVIVSLVMNDNDILQKVEKSFFYLSDIDFSYNGINVHLPGIAESNHLIPTGTVVMLEVDLKFDRKLNPFIEWYDGKKKIAEGKASDGMGNLFWTAPEESGFYSIKAVIFPVEKTKYLSGYQKELSLLVSVKSVDIHLTNENVPYKQGSLINWYVFESNLKDSRKLSNAEQSDAKQINEERALKHARNAPVWKASDGTYGVVAGNNNIINAPTVLLSENERHNWQILFRFKPENDGGILSVQFGKSNSVFIHSYIENSNLFLTLTSATDSVTQTYSLNRPVPENNAPAINLPASESAQSVSVLTEIEVKKTEEPDVPAEETAEPVGSQVIEKMWGSDGSFITAGIVFNIQSGVLSAKLNILGDRIDSEIDGKPITLETEMKTEFQIMLGFLQENKKPVEQRQIAGSTEEASGKSAVIRHEYTALWDELALYRMPQTEILSAKPNQHSGEEQTAASQAAESKGSSPSS